MSTSTDNQGLENDSWARESLNEGLTCGYTTGIVAADPHPTGSHRSSASKKDARIAKWNHNLGDVSGHVYGT